MVKSSEGRPRPKKPPRWRVSIEARVSAVAVILGVDEAVRWAKHKEKMQNGWGRARNRKYPWRRRSGLASSSNRRAGIKLVKKMLKRENTPGWNRDVKVRRRLRQACA